MRHGNLAAEPCLKALHQLRCQRNFRHQHQHLPACIHSMSRRTQVNLRLAAARNALQQKGLRTLRIYRLINLYCGILLLRRQLQLSPRSCSVL